MRSAMPRCAVRLAARCCVLAVLAASAGASAEPWRFVVVGDTRSTGNTDNNGVNVPILTEIASAVVAENPRLLLIPGDLVNSGSYVNASNVRSFDTFLSTIQPVYTAGIGVYPVRGNHDVESNGYWAQAFPSVPQNGPTGETGKTYSFTAGNATFIALDQYVRTNRNNQTWLNSQLAAAADNSTHTFVFGHAPAFKINHSDGLTSYPGSRDTFWRSLTAWGVKGYFAGHDHFYDHARIADADGNPANDLHQFIAGGGGAPLSSDSTYNGNNGPWTPTRVLHDASFGYVVVDVDGSNVTLTYKKRTAANTFATAETFSYTQSPLQTRTVALQQGDNGYTGAADTHVRENATDAGTDASAALKLNVDADEPSGSGKRSQALVRFGSLFSDEGGSIPRGAAITSAYLTLTTGGSSSDNSASTIELHRMSPLTSGAWSDTDTWNSLANGISLDGNEALASVESSLVANVLNAMASFDVTASVQAWSNGAANHGWLLRAFSPRP